MESQKYYKKIIGGSKEDKDLAQKELQDAFYSKSEDFSKYEIQKTPEDLEIIQKVEKIVNEIITKYGGETGSVPLDNIYILHPGSVKTITKGKHLGGLHRPWSLKIAAEKYDSTLLFACTLAHELFHLKSYKSARVITQQEGAQPYRTGLSMFDIKTPENENAREYFGIMEEAIVSECVKEFVQEISKEKDFSNEALASRKFVEWVVLHYRRIGVPEEKIKELVSEVKYVKNSEEKVEDVIAFSDNEEKRAAYATGMFEALYDDGKVEAFERYFERTKLYNLLDKIILNSEGKFKDREEIFKEFARANFSGNYIPLARIIEEILGAGSFRKLAEEFSKEPKK